MKRPITPFIIAVVAFLVVIFGGIAIFGALSGGSSPTISTQAVPTGTTNVSILKPATVPPKANECSVSLTYASNGNPSPITCSGNEINVQAWNALAALEPRVMKLGYSPTATQVEQAICFDGNDANVDSSPIISAPLESSIYTLASLYYGWHFNINPTALLSSGC